MLAYHGVLAGFALWDGLTLPAGSGWRAERRLPRPLALGVEQTATVRVGHPAAAGLLVEVADHAPRELRPSRRVMEGLADSRGEVNAAYTVQPARRGAYQFGPVDVRCRRRRGA